jgi:hypothetical protein
VMYFVHKSNANLQMYPLMNGDGIGMGIRFWSLRRFFQVSYNMYACKMYDVSFARS